MAKRQGRAARVDGTVGSIQVDIEEKYGLPSGSVRLLNSDGTPARTDKTIGALLKDYANLR